MLYPSIQELLKLSADEQGNERLNKYTLVMATAKCARIITNENRARKDAEKANGERRDYKKEFPKDEKAVRSAVRSLRNGEFDVFFEGDEGYEDSVVDVRALDAEYEEKLMRIEEQERYEKKKALEKSTFDDTADLMNASEVYVDDAGLAESDEDAGIIA